MWLLMSSNYRLIWIEVISKLHNNGVKSLTVLDPERRCWATSAPQGSTETITLNQKMPCPIFTAEDSGGQRNAINLIAISSVIIPQPFPRDVFIIRCISQPNKYSRLQCYYTIKKTLSCYMEYYKLDLECNRPERDSYYSLPCPNFSIFVYPPEEYCKGSKKKSASL